MVLIATDVPEPVVPAISICGVRARSMMMDSPPIVLAEAERELDAAVIGVLHGQQFAQVDVFAMGVRQLDADGVATGDDGDAGGQRAHGARDIVGKADHARRLDARCGFEFVQRDDGAGIGFDDLAAHAEVLQHAFQRARIGFDLGLAERLAIGGLRRGEHADETATRTCRWIGAPAPWSWDFLAGLRGGLLFLFFFLVVLLFVFVVIALVFVMRCN